ncbi:hypothetical protein [Paenibacillus sp. FSL E2-0178]|uniref:hypothetical protein n=1 Tax=Paenibacillus sp. FSL E2-0178 TaxID=2921361 RepID=UPI0031591F0C
MKTKELKVSHVVRETYMKYCWRSTAKCESLYEVDYKIRRAAYLGAVIQTYPEKVIHYHNLRLVIKDNNIIGLSMNNEEYIKVSEKRKYTYDQLNDKVLV